MTLIFIYAFDFFGAGVVKVCEDLIVRHVIDPALG